jgi:phosphopantetheine adenylyltransferase
MHKKCKEAEANGKIALADFVCPFQKARDSFGADYTIWVDTIREGRFEDTNKVFEPAQADTYDYRIKTWNDKDAVNLAWIIGDLFIWNHKAPTTQMLGRFQPWHAGHQALFERALAKHGQVYLMIRTMELSENNPYDAIDVRQNLKRELVKYAGKVNIQVVPNIINITYGRDVGYKIEQEHFDKSIESISATKIRNERK